MQPFVTRARYTRLECEQQDYEGLWAEVRTNLTHGEREAFIDALRELDDRQEAWQQERGAEAAGLDAAVAEAESAEAKQEAEAARKAWLRQVEDRGAEIRAARLSLIAPYIRAWNVCTEDETGAVVDVPAPIDGGLASFDFTDEVIENWLVIGVVVGYRTGKGVRSSASGSSGSPARTSGPQIVSEPESA